LSSYADYVPPAEDGIVNESLKRVRKPGWDKANFKTRGSIASQFRRHEADSSGPSKFTMGVQARLREGEEKDKRRKARLTRKVLPDVFIPSTVSVGQLARLLNVRLSRCCFSAGVISVLISWVYAEQLQKKMVTAGMAEESAYDHGMPPNLIRNTHLLIDCCIGDSFDIRIRCLTSGRIQQKSSG
jgi:translation initiation factor IF-2